MHIRTLLAVRDRIQRRQKKWKRAGDLAREVLDTCVMTPEEAKEKYGCRTKAGAAFSAALGTFSMTGRAFATGNNVTEFTTVQKATDLLLSILMGVGVCFIALGVISLAVSFQSHDDSQKSKAIMAIVGGSIAVSVRAVLTALGINPNDVTASPS